MAGRLACTPRAVVALAVAAVAAVFTCSAPARAQVNVEALRTDLDQHPLYLSLQASFAGHLGNTNGAVGGGAAFAGITSGRHMAFVKFQGDFAEFSGKVSIEKAFTHARYDVRLFPFLYGEVFAQIEENPFQRLAIRQVDGVGLRVSIVERREVHLFVGTAWMADYEKLSDDTLLLGTFVGPHWWAQRWSNYASVAWKMNDRARFSDALYVQPRWNAFSDYRLFNDAAFVMDIDKRFSAKIDCQVHYNSAPPSRVLPLDVDTVTSLVFTL
jgi:putative salt-induced outer membrane protein YdiY